MKVYKSSEELILDKKGKPFTTPIPIEQEIPDWQCWIADGIFYIFLSAFVYALYLFLRLVVIPYAKALMFYNEHGWCCEGRLFNW